MTGNDTEENNEVSRNKLSGNIHGVIFLLILTTQHITSASTTSTKQGTCANILFWCI